MNDDYYDGGGDSYRSGGLLATPAGPLLSGNNAGVGGSHSQKPVLKQGKKVSDMILVESVGENHFLK
jgi:hypothetical protein